MVVSEILLYNKFLEMIVTNLIKEVYGQCKNVKLVKTYFWFFVYKKKNTRVDS